MRFDLSVAPIVYLCQYRALGDRSALTMLQKMLFPIYTSHCHLPRLHHRYRSDFAVGFMSFVFVSSDTRRQESSVSEGVELGFIGHAYDQNERLREGKDTWQEG